MWSRAWPWPCQRCVGQFDSQGAHLESLAAGSEAVAAPTLRASRLISGPRYFTPEAMPHDDEYVGELAPSLASHHTVGDHSAAGASSTLVGSDSVAASAHAPSEVYSRSSNIGDDPAVSGEDCEDDGDRQGPSR